MRISDWSSDVCSSDLRLLHGERAVEGLVQEGVGIGGGQFRGRLAVALDERLLVGLETGLDLGRTGECSRRKQGGQQRRDGSAPRHIASHHIGGVPTLGPALPPVPRSRSASVYRSEERRVGKEWVRQGESWGVTDHLKNKGRGVGIETRV